MVFAKCLCGACKCFRGVYLWCAWGVNGVFVRCLWCYEEFVVLVRCLRCLWGVCGSLSGIWGACGVFLRFVGCL